MKCAFVASGGGLKAFAFHLGVLRALEEHGFRRMLADGSLGPGADGATPITTYIGSSAGACAAAACVYFETLDEAEGVIGLRPTSLPRFNRRVLFRPNLGWLGRRRFAGLFHARGVADYFRARATIDDFRALKPEVYVCATQLNGSRKVIFGPRDSAENGRYNRFVAYYNDVPVSQAIAASVSVPGFFSPYPIVNQRSGEMFEYVDGEVRETLSVHIARDTGVDLVMVSNVWMPYHYDPLVGSVSRMGIGQILSQSMTKIIEQKVDRVRNEFDRYSLALEAIRKVASREGLRPETVLALVTEVAEALRYRDMEEVYITVARDDSTFNLASAWTFKRALLELARDVGYRRAKAVLEAREARLRDQKAAPST